MASNKSEHLNLHLWEGEDNFLRTEFNENFQAIDAGVKAEQEARKAAVTDLEARVTQAQTTADTALATLPYAVGHYKSTGEEVHITVGFRPSAVLFHGNYQNGGTGGNNYSLYTDGSAYIGKVSFTDDGFTVKVDESVTRNPDINYLGRTYAYLALK